MTNRFLNLLDRIFISIVIVVCCYCLYFFVSQLRANDSANYVKHKSGVVGAVVTKNRHSYNVMYINNKGKIVSEVWMNRDIRF